MRAITAAAAAALDAALMAEGGLFSLDTLVEAAGTCVALALVDAFPRVSFPSVLVACGPGNNGCDGLNARWKSLLIEYSALQAMAAFAPPAAGQTTLPPAYQDTLAPVIAANWQ